tara:strand:+ start:377 stop:703 length:327 start_codon:yes stop_codon:yes gene_type:complete
MWNVDTKILCNKHLLGEHVEMHMFVGTINKGISIRGYIEKGLVEPCIIKQRHEELAFELVRRGMNHLSPLPKITKIKTDWSHAKVDVEDNIRELKKRCTDCNARISHL